MSSAIAPLSAINCIRPTDIQTAAPAGWDTAIANVERHGTFMGGTPLGDTLGVADIQGPRDGTHQADYMNLWGGRTQDGVWHTGMVSLVSESWQLQADGNHRISQWIHQMSPDGSQRRSMQNVLVRGPTGRIFDSGSIPFTEDEAAANVAALVAKFGSQTAPSVHGFAACSRVGDHVVRALRHVEPCTNLLPQLRAPATTGGFGLRRS